jgi:plastocyanin
MRIDTRSCRILLVAMAASACGGGSDDPPTTNNQVAASLQVTMSGTSPITAIGDSRTLSVSVRDANNVVIPGAPVSFATSNASVVTVSGAGNVVATGNGDATITATSGSATGQVQVTVAQRLSSVTLATTPVVMGATAQLTPAAQDSRGNVITGATGFTITSATPSVAVVNAAGLLTAIGPGTANLTASLTRDGVTATTNSTQTVTLPTAQTGPVTVTASILTVFDPSNVTVERGGTVNFVFQALAHNVTFTTAGAPANIGDLANTSQSRVFNTVGSFPYTCTLHVNMNGTVNVVQTAFSAAMSGANERPTPSTSTGTGAASFRRTGESVSYIVTYQGLTGAPTGAHLHGPASASQVADIIVEFSVAGQTSTTGVLTGTFTASAIRGVNGQPPMSLDQLVALLNAGNSYVNVHTTQFPGGEIRGQVSPP